MLESSGNEERSEMAARIQSLEEEKQLVDCLTEQLKASLQDAKSNHEKLQKSYDQLAKNMDGDELQKELLDERDKTVKKNALLTENLTPSAEDGQSRSRRAPQSEVFRINRPLMKKLANRTECQRELMNASSEPQEDGSLRIFDIQAGCLLDKVGIQNEDRLKMVDGKPLDFTSMGAVFSSHSNSLSKLQSGQPVVIQIERRGRMVALVIDPTGI